MSLGYVGILAIHLHLPDAESLKEKRPHVARLKADLARRFSAAVAEVDHHERWQRSLVTAVIVDRHARPCEERLDAIERWVLGRNESASIAYRTMVTPEEVDDLGSRTDDPARTTGG